jgi:uroporphyrinogen-III synthase
MSANVHIVSTRTLASKSVRKLIDFGWRLSVHDFITKRFVIPENLSGESIGKNVVLTSQTGVEAFLQLISQLQLDKFAYSVFCIDQATLKSAKDAGLHVKASAPHAVALAAEIRARKEIKEVTHLCSNRRRGELSEKLKSSGVTVLDVVAYQTDLTPVRIESSYDAVVFFSPSAIDSFLSLNPFVDVPCFCIGKTTESHARKMNYTDTFVPETSREEALIDLLIHHFSNTSVHVKE